MARILMPLPDVDFDTTEVVVPWTLLREAGHEVVFATETGAVPATDPLLLTGVLFGQLGAEPEPRALYEKLRVDPAFLHPTPWDQVDAADVDGLFLAGGHAPGMRQYLGSTVLQQLVLQIWSRNVPVAAICHGVLVLARTIDPSTGRSVLLDKNTTCLPRYMEAVAYYLTSWKLGRYYRTYAMYVQDEVSAALRAPAQQFHRGPITLVTRGSRQSNKGAFVVDDGRYLSARWPGDAWALGRLFVSRLANPTQCDSCG